MNKIVKKMTLLTLAVLLGAQHGTSYAGWNFKEFLPDFRAQMTRYMGNAGQYLKSFTPWQYGLVGASALAGLSLVGYLMYQRGNKSVTADGSGFDDGNGVVESVEPGNNVAEGLGKNKEPVDADLQDKNSDVSEAQGKGLPIESTEIGKGVVIGEVKDDKDPNQEDEDFIVPDFVENVTPEEKNKGLAGEEIFKAIKNGAYNERKSDQDYLNDVVNFLWYVHICVAAKKQAYTHGTLVLEDSEDKIRTFLINYVKKSIQSAQRRLDSGEKVANSEPNRTNSNDLGQELVNNFWFNIKRVSEYISSYAIPKDMHTPMIGMVHPFFKAYPRVSTHFNKYITACGNAEKPEYTQYGIDMLCDNKGNLVYTLPVENMKHILFGKLNEQFIFIKFEEYGLSGVQEAVAHAGGLAASVTRKVTGKGNDEPYMQKEHVPEKLLVDYKELLTECCSEESIEFKFQQAQTFGIQRMLIDIDLLIADNQKNVVLNNNFSEIVDKLKEFKKTSLEEKYDHLKSRIGNEVILKQQDLEQDAKVKQLLAIKDN